MEGSRPLYSIGIQLKQKVSTFVEDYEKFPRTRQAVLLLKSMFCLTL